MDNNERITSALERFGISQAELSRCLGVDRSAISHRVKRGWPTWTVAEALSLLALINREHDPEFTLEDLVGSVGEQPLVDKLPKSDPCAGFTPRTTGRSV